MIPELSSRFLVVVNSAATLYMVGLIWVIQVVHYPLFSQVGRAAFAAYEADHTRLITLIVGPPMLVEAATAGLLALSPPRGIPGAWLLAGLALLGVAWAVTAFFSVPAHTTLAGGFEAGAHGSLVKTNWLRTLAWSARGVLMCAILYRMMLPSVEVTP